MPPYSRRRGSATRGDEVGEGLVAALGPRRVPSGGGPARVADGAPGRRSQEVAGALRAGTSPAVGPEHGPSTRRGGASRAGLTTSCYLLPPPARPGSGWRVALQWRVFRVLLPGRSICLGDVGKRVSQRNLLGKRATHPPPATQRTALLPCRRRVALMAVRFPAAHHSRIPGLFPWNIPVRLGRARSEGAPEARGSRPGLASPRGARHSCCAFRGNIPPGKPE